MPALDYYAVEQGIQAVLAAGTSMPNANKIFIEAEVLFDINICPAIFVYLERRDAQAAMQRLAAGTRTDFLLYFSIWCVEAFIGSMRDACSRRDTLIGNAEVALMNDHSLNGTVVTSWLEGGRFMTGQAGDNSFVAAGEIILVAQGNATT